jgi:protein-S-isoprenylcysteine O-methyltransferase Ste14
MRIVYAYLIPALWVTWCVYWLIAARDVKPTRRKESVASRAWHVIPLAVAMMLIAIPTLPGGFLPGRILPATRFVFFTGAVFVAAGLAFSVWARTYLGRNWSGSVTLKTDHELIRRGPYRLVRHPIYTGLLVAIVGLAIVRGEWRGVVAVAIAAVALWRKLRLEERWLGETFGDAYAKYRAEVSALIPFVL